MNLQILIYLKSLQSKQSPDELNALTGISTIDGMNVLQKKGIEYVILTDKQNISLLFGGKIYSLKLPNIELYDTTGIGDIFSTTFCCTIIIRKKIFCGR